MSHTPLRLAHLCFLVVWCHTLLAVPPVSPPEAQRQGWPNISGPLGNFQGLPSTTPLIDDLSLATLAWTSEAQHFGAGKAGGVKRNTEQDLLDSFGPDRTRWAGSLTGPVMAEDVVYVASFRPGGKPITIRGKAGRGDKPVLFEQPIELQLEAEDTLTAIDAKTGKTLWTFVESGGLCWTQGKRGGLQIAPAVHDGVVYFVGTMGDLYAIDAKSGKKLWENDLGPAHAWMKLEKDWYLSGGKMELDKKTARKLKGVPTLEEGIYVQPRTPTWHGGIRVLEGIVIANDSSSGLVAFDSHTGKQLWHRSGVSSFMAAPSVWRSNGKEYILTAGPSAKDGISPGFLRLIDPKSGADIWVEEIGPTYPTLAPSGDLVLVNSRVPKSKGDLNTGLVACYELSLDGAKRLWSLPDEPKYYIPLKKDSLGRVRYTIQGDRALINTHGMKLKGKDGKNRVHRGVSVTVDARTGDILDEYRPQRKIQALKNFSYVVGDRIYSSWDRHHSPNRGGRKPIVLSHWDESGIRPITNEHGTPALDLANLTGGYEVTMESPIVDGRMYERTTSGALVCYDLRKRDSEVVYRLLATDAWRGLDTPIPLTIRVDGTKIVSAASYPGDQPRVGQVYTTSRTSDFWRDFPVDSLKIEENKLTGAIKLDVVGEALPSTFIGLTLDIDLKSDELSGSWSRTVPALEGLPTTRGKATGNISRTHRFANTPWLPHQPKTNFYELDDGQLSLVINLAGAMPSTDKNGNHPNLGISLVHDGTNFVAGSGGAFRFSQGWHEVDAKELNLKDGRITGDLILIAHGDNYGTKARGEEDGPLAGKIKLDIDLQGESLEGNYQAEWGVPYSAEGNIVGTIEALQ